MLPIETLKLMRRKILKQLAAKNMRYRASWSDKVWDRKYDKKFDIKKRLYVIEYCIEYYGGCQLICEVNKWSFGKFYKDIYMRTILDMTIRPNQFRIHERVRN